MSFICADERICPVFSRMDTLCHVTSQAGSEAGGKGPEALTGYKHRTGGTQALGRLRVGRRRALPGKAGAQGAKA